MAEENESLKKYAVKRFGEILVFKTVQKFKMDLEHLAYLLHTHRSENQILEYWKMLNLDLDTKVGEWVGKHGGLAGLAAGKKETIDGVVKEFSDYFKENAKAWADAEKKSQEAAKNRRKFIYQVFAELGNNMSENDLIMGVLQLSGVGLKEMAAQKEAIKAELDTMGEEDKLGWVTEGGSGIVLLEDEKGETTDEAATFAKKTQNYRPLRGRAAVAAGKGKRK